MSLVVAIDSESFRALTSIVLVTNIDGKGGSGSPRRSAAKIG